MIISYIYVRNDSVCFNWSIFLYMVTHNYTSTCISFNFVTIYDIYDYPGKRAEWLWEF